MSRNDEIQIDLAMPPQSIGYDWSLQKLKVVRVVHLFLPLLFLITLAVAALKLVISHSKLFTLYISSSSSLTMVESNEPMFKTARVSHLGGIEASYKISGSYKQYKPTLILINSFTTSADLYDAQFENKELTEAMNLIAIEPLGHGKTKLRAGTRTESESQNFTYWDTAIMNLQVMEVIGVKKAFVLGTSQGGWITVRMALLAPDKVRIALRFHQPTR